MEMSKVRKVKPVERQLDGRIVLNLAVDELNDSWLSSARLLRMGTEESLIEYEHRSGSPMYEFTEEE